MRKVSKFFSRLGRFNRNESGQGMTEYIIIVALVAVFSIGIITAFGDNIRGLFAASASALAGKEKINTKDYVKEVGAEKVARKKGLQEFERYNEAP